MTADQYRAWLRKQIKNSFDGSQSAAAEAWGISESFMSEILRGNREPSKKLLVGTGHIRRMTYAPIAGVLK